MADHAERQRSAAAEWPMWLCWRVLTWLAPPYQWAAARCTSWLDTYREESPLNQRLAVAAAVLAAVAVALAVALVLLLV